MLWYVYHSKNILIFFFVHIYIFGNVKAAEILSLGRIILHICKRLPSVVWTSHAQSILIYFLYLKLCRHMAYLSNQVWFSLPQLQPQSMALHIFAQKSTLVCLINSTMWLYTQMEDACNCGSQFVDVFSMFCEWLRSFMKKESVKLHHVYFLLYFYVCVCVSRCGQWMGRCSYVSTYVPRCVSTSKYLSISFVLLKKLPTCSIQPWEAFLWD